ncbi:uncharacterized protein LOC114944869 [Nylanderia fulva]|uniref:uncharacterized protein LOC114944869 n=1 Tax=Nylanderia fulva TaxID=613905 RepID=UPI0010FB8F55|nr:uncharacterized protein LOC114944869 [Nylanderia fulva]
MAQRGEPGGHTWLSTTPRRAGRRPTPVASSSTGAPLPGRDSCCRRRTLRPPRSSLIKLNPFIDDHGVLRVGGRLKHALLPYDEKHPDRRQAATASVRHLHSLARCHATASNGPPSSGPSDANSTFLEHWTGLRGTNFHPDQQGTRHRSQKGYIAVFVCFWSKAIHLEVVSDYSSEAFIAALRRFVSRRGLCTDVYSDCGTTFVGADRTLRELFKASTSEGLHIARAANTQGIRWHFNPPAAPHFGGLWEAAVKSTKFHLRRVIGDTTLTFEELNTLLTQIEACLNSRPLQALSDDPDDTSALTPGHFIIGAPLLAIPEPSRIGQSSSTLSRWHHLH